MKSNIFAVTVGLCCVACGEGPTNPVFPPGTVVRLELTAPREIASGESAALTALAFKTGGTSEDVSNQVQWTAQSATESAAFTVSGSGILTATGRGRGVVTARFSGLTAEASIFVLPRGTFRLAGKIVESGVGLEDVTVSVISGIGQGLSATTDALGNYELYGVAGPVSIRASREGYVASIRQVDVTAHGSLELELAVVRPRDNYSGVYTLTIAGDHCTADFPEVAKVRVYDARLEHDGRGLRVFLSGGKFWRAGNAFTGTVSSNGEIRFTIRPVQPWDYDAFDLMESLPGGPDLIVGGIIVAAPTATGIVQTHQDDPYVGGFMHLNLGNGRCGGIGRFELMRR